ncbi:MAG: Uma2 family endonuclease, partial [Hymenobacter sp.]
MPSAITSLAQLDPNGSYTYADYLGWKFQEFVELIRGKLMRPMAGPSARHQRLSQRLEYAIGSFLGRGPCEMFHAPFGVRLTRDTGNGDAQIRTVVQPDIFVVCDKNKIDERGCLGAPDWIIEILSPGNSSHDTKTKFDLYEENGVHEYWIVVPG